MGEAATIWVDTKADKKTVGQLTRRAAVAASLIGTSTPVNEVTFSDIQTAVQKRKRQGAANATINRDIIATMRPTIALQRKLLNDGKGAPVPFPEIAWGDLSLPEPKPKPRGLSAEGMAKLLAALPPHMHDFARFQARYACRLDEMFFPPADLDIEGARVLLRERKGDDDHSLPLSKGDLPWLAARKSRAERAGLDVVWWRPPRPKERDARGRALPPDALVALSYPAALRAVSKAMLRAGLKAKGERRATHAFRHTGAMKALRDTGNVRMAQKLLGHASLQSTLVYAHVMEDDLRAYLDDEPRPAPEPGVDGIGDGAKKPLRGKA